MKNKTNIIFLALGIFGLMIMGIVIADTVLTQFTKTSTMDKAQRDYLLTKLPTVMDKGQPLPKEIKPEINIVCWTKECKFSAYQDGLISSYDNVIQREYCFEFKEGNCTKTSIYTLIEIQDQVSTAVTNRLSDYANSSINEETKIITETSNGSITITEKR